LFFTNLRPAIYEISHLFKTPSQESFVAAVRALGSCYSESDAKEARAELELLLYNGVDGNALVDQKSPIQYLKDCRDSIWQRLFSYGKAEITEALELLERFTPLQVIVQ